MTWQRWFTPLIVMLVTLGLIHRPAQAQVDVAAAMAAGLAEAGLDLATGVAQDYLSRKIPEWTAPGPKLTDDRHREAEIQEVKRQLVQLATRDAEHAGELRNLTYRLDATMSRAEVAALMIGTLSRIDQRFARITARIEAQQRASAAQSRRIDRQDVRLDRIDQDLAAFYRMYSRDTPVEQGVAIASEGFKALAARDYPAAVRSFRFAHATDPTAPEHLYGQAIAHFLAGERAAANDTIVRAVVAERSRALPRWFGRTFEPIQGPHREFMEKARRDPLYGTRAPGIPQTPSLADHR